MSASVNQVASGSRSRPQARKKVNDDAAYFGPPSGSGVTGTKRQATDKADGDLNRAKRKRVETTHSTMTNGKKDAPDPDKQPMDFYKLPTSKLYRYLIQFDIVPSVHPSPLSPEDPPPPSYLADPQRQHSRPPSPPALTPANRPRRDPKDSVSRRRSSRLLEEEVRSRTPILSDIQELHGVLASMVDQHFKEKTSMNGREEVDTLAAFMCKVEGPDYRTDVRVPF